jgi:hypothetical protein
MVLPDGTLWRFSFRAQSVTNPGFNQNSDSRLKTYYIIREGNFRKDRTRQVPQPAATSQLETIPACCRTRARACACVLCVGLCAGWVAGRARQDLLGLGLGAEVDCCDKEVNLSGTIHHAVPKYTCVRRSMTPMPCPSRQPAVRWQLLPASPKGVSPKPDASGKRWAAGDQRTLGEFAMAPVSSVRGTLDSCGDCS